MTGFPSVSVGTTSSPSSKNLSFESSGLRPQAPVQGPVAYFNLRQAQLRGLRHGISAKKQLDAQQKEYLLALNLEPESRLCVSIPDTLSYSFK